MRKSLTKQELLRRKSDISRIFSEGLSVSVRGMKLVYRENGLNWTRLLVIPARKYGNAVERNLLKRRIKEIYRTEKELLAKGYDIAFVIYPGTVYGFAKRKEQFLKLVEKAGLLENSSASS
ncbi:MAG: ribonuclease P protein component [Spirochaetota bacterium]